MHARMAPSDNEKDDFSRLLRDVRAGVAPFASIEEHGHFLSRARQMCRRVVRDYSDAGYDAEDLFVDACLWMLAGESRFTREGSLPRTQGRAREELSDADAFFRWFLVLAANLFRREMMNWPGGFRYGRRVDFVPLRECPPVADSGVDIEGGCLLREFRDFIAESLPAAHRRAVEMWLENYSLSEIRRALHGEGVRCSDTSLRRWIADSLKNFAAPRSH